MSQVSHSDTLEDVLDKTVNAVFDEVHVAGHGRARTDWDRFVRLSKLVHERFEIPSTTITPAMRRMLYAIGSRLEPTRVVGIGTYVGYALCWLLDSFPLQRRALSKVIAVDIDEGANVLARRNLSLLGHGNVISVLDADGESVAADLCVDADLLYVDLDDPNRGKEPYANVLRAALKTLPAGSVILAHDLAHPLFTDARAAYEAVVAESGRARTHYVLPIDECGLAVTVVGNAH